MSSNKFNNVASASYFLIFDFCRVQGGELFERVIDDDFVLTEKACAVFMKQICEGMEYIHSRSIIHLDMKVGRNSVGYIVF